MFSKIARTITVVPITALLTLILLCLFEPGLFSSASWVFIIGFFLCVFPLLAYSMQPFFPKFKHQGRKGQRTLAFIFAVSGYIMALICCWFFPLDTALVYFVWIYFFSALLLVILNFGFHIYASAHASGVTCSTLILLYFLGKQHIFILFPVITMVLVWFSSLKMHRHKWYELLIGSILPLAAYPFVQYIS